MYSQPNPPKPAILTWNMRENFARSFDFFQQFSCNLSLKGIFVHWSEKHGRQPIRFCPICVPEPISTTYVKWLSTYQLAFFYAMSKIKAINFFFFFNIWSLKMILTTFNRHTYNFGWTLDNHIWVFNVCWRCQDNLYFFCFSPAVFYLPKRYCLIEDIKKFL